MSWWWHWSMTEGRQRERRREKMAKTEGKGWFLVNFGPTFLHAQTIKSTPIYKG
jgi:hypothetical protein